MTKFRRQKFKVETAKKLLKVAKDDLYAAEVLLTAPKARPETVLYLVQQGIEKSLKAVLIHRQQSVPLTHDIDVLISELPEILINNLPPGAGELTQYATIRRYIDGEELLEKSDLLEAHAVGVIFTTWANNEISKID
ncbi:MAG: HEPN domain-containing protein [Bdellovibrionaceae bacterium]|nr:HEPN domain-containing protein [Pseudobdellovibrionaceae bacterium]